MEHSVVAPAGGPVKDKILRHVSLSRYTTYHIGGPAEYFAEAACRDDLKALILYARSMRLPLFLLGGGSNVLVSDRGVRGIVVRNISGAFSFGPGEVTVESGLALAALLHEAGERGAGGLEFLAGIPGSVGGALYGNAGAYGRSIGEKLTRATVISPDGIEKTVGRDYFHFSYRHSAIKESGDIILDATLAVEERDPGLIGEEMSRIIEERKGKHPCGAGSCGCYFKNVDGPGPGGEKISAGKLLEQAGASSMSCGGACVSGKHANFILNRGNATALEIRALAGMIRQKVFEKFNIVLEEEVQLVGDFFRHALAGHDHGAGPVCARTDVQQVNGVGQHG